MLFTFIVIFSVLIIFCAFCVDNNPYTFLGRMKLSFINNVVKTIFSFFPESIRVRLEYLANYVLWQKNPIVQVYNHYNLRLPTQRL